MKMQFKVIYRLVLLLVIIFLIPKIQVLASNGDKYSTIGGVDITVQKKSEIQSLLANEISRWKEREIRIEGQSGSLTVPTSYIQFNVKETVEQFIQSQKKPWYQFWVKSPIVHLPIKVQLSDEINELFKDAPFFYIEETKEMIEKQAQYLSSEIIVPKEMPMTKDYLERIAFEIHPLIDHSSLLSDYIPTLEGIVIGRDERFSFLERFESIGNPSNLEVENFFLSVLYSALLQTEAKIVERHSQQVIPTYLSPGIEATVNRALNKDFVFINQSNSPMLFSASLKDNHLLIEIFSLPNARNVSYSTKETFIQPRTIYRLSSSLANGEERVVDEGSDGMQVIVYQSFFDPILGVQVDVEASRDFYPPSPKVIEVSIDKESSVLPENEGDSDDNENKDGRTDEENGQGNIEQPKDQNNEEKADGDTNVTEKEVRYDKGGNIIPDGKS